MVAPTYQRAAQLPEFLSRYASGNVTSLKRIVLLWNEVDTEPPQSLVKSLPSFNVPVIIEQRHINSLNQRFHETEYITTECVLAMDDDMLYHPEDVEFGYQTWKSFGQGRKRMIGYHQRAVSTDGRYDVGGKSYRYVGSAENATGVIVRIAS